MDAAPAKRRGRARWSALIVALVALALTLPWIGGPGFSMSEGHRVAPGWAMLEHGDWLVPHMFERVYLRKPPGMPWAIAASSRVFGQTHFGARFPSALALAIAGVASCWFATRWYPGRARAGLIAGLGLVLMPVFWSPATTAEIEMLHNALVLIAALAVLDLGLASKKSALVGVIGSVALGGALLTKGPAGVPVVLAAGAALLLTRAAGAGRVLGRLAFMALAAAALFAPVMLAMKQAAGLPGAVIQGVDEFLWAKQKLASIAVLPLMGLLAALPASLAMLFPWGPDAVREAEADPGPRRVARVTTVALVVALVIYTLAGVSNPRYLMPALGLAALPLPYVLAGLGVMTPKRQSIARVMMLGGPTIALALLLSVGLVAGMVGSRQRDRSSGERLGRELGALVQRAGAEPAVVLADHAIEARPEVLLSLEAASAAGGLRARGVWTTLGPEHLPPVGGYLLLREDDQSDELARLTSQGVLGGFRRVGGGDVSKFSFGLYLREY